MIIEYKTGHLPLEFMSECFLCQDNFTPIGKIVFYSYDSKSLCGMMYTVAIFKVKRK